MRRHLAFRSVIRGKKDERVFELLRLVQRLDESAENVIEFHHTVAIDRTSGGTTRVLVVGIVVEMAAAGSVV